MLADYVFDGQLNEKKIVSLVSSTTVVLLIVRIFDACSMFGEGRFFVRDGCDRFDEGSRSATNKIFPENHKQCRGNSRISNTYRLGGVLSAKGAEGRMSKSRSVPDFPYHTLWMHLR